VLRNYNFMDCILLCMKYQVINSIAINTTLFFNNNLFVVFDHLRCVHVRPDDDQKLWSKHVA
jgi:hypothetical protein